LSNESKKQISALVVVVVVVARLLDAVFEVVVARHLLDAVVVVIAEITNSHPSHSPAPSWGPSPRSSPSPSCPRPTESHQRIWGKRDVRPTILKKPRSTTATVPAYPRREGRRLPKRCEAALQAQPPPASRALPPTPGGSHTETQGWLQEEHGFQLLARPRLPGQSPQAHPPPAPLRAQPPGLTRREGPRCPCCRARSLRSAAPRTTCSATPASC